MVKTNKQLLSEWAPVLNNADVQPVKASQKEAWAKVLENQKNLGTKTSSLLGEATPTNVTGNIAKWNPVLVSMVRRAIPQLVGPELFGLQPLTLPSGMIFALRAKSAGSAANGKSDTVGGELFISAPDTRFTGAGAAGSAGLASDTVNDPFATYTVAGALATATGEGNITPEIKIDVESVTVEAKTRKLKARYSAEMAEDMERVHGLSAVDELSRAIQEELVREQNQEAFRTMVRVAKVGCQQTGINTPGTFSLAASSGDSDGQWIAERIKHLMLQIGFESNAVMLDAKRGKATKLVVSPNVATALAEVGIIDVQGAQTQYAGKYEVDSFKSAYVGRINNMYDMYIDPFAAVDYALVGYKGEGEQDAGLFYCPYVPLTMAVATDPDSLQPIIGFRDRYGLISNPFVVDGNGTADGTTFGANLNGYFRKFAITGLI